MCVCVYVCVFMCVCLCVYVCVYVYMFILFVCVFLCVHVHVCGCALASEAPHVKPACKLGVPGFFRTVFR